MMRVLTVIAITFTLVSGNLSAAFAWGVVLVLEHRLRKQASYVERADEAVHDTAQWLRECFPEYARPKLRIIEGGR
jgi:hypothetical protein